MTDIPNLAFEAQLWSATHRINAKKEDKTVIVMHVHPSEAAQLMDSDLLGKRFQCVLVAIGDDEQPVKVGPRPVTQGESDVLQEALIDSCEMVDPAEPAKPKRRFDEMPRAQQAGVLCGDPAFWAWAEQSLAAAGSVPTPLNNAEDCATVVRLYCGVASRRDLDGPDTRFVAEQWDGLVSDYRQATGQVAEQRG